MPPTLAIGAASAATNKIRILTGFCWLQFYIFLRDYIRDGVGLVRIIEMLKLSVSIR